MKVAIMQPYFLPYIGYFQLIAAADLFIIYDNIKYTKKGWINRNRLLSQGTDVVFTIPLASDSDSLDIRERSLSENFHRDKMLNKFRESYRRAPHFPETFSLLQEILRFQDRNLFHFLRFSISRTCLSLGISTEIRESSSFAIDHGLKGQDRVTALCEAAGASTYINPIGGVGLYSREAFAAHGIELKFLRATPLGYPQFDHDFVPWLSIVDVMMFNPPEACQDLLRSFFELN